MSRIFALAALLLLMYLLLRLPGGGAATLSMSLGFLLLGGYLLGKLAKRIGLPGITGYLCAGIVFGPHGMSFLGRDAVHDLAAINHFALTLIALTAGGEVDLRRVRQRLKTYVLVTTSQIVITLAGVSIAMFLAVRSGDFGLEATECLVFALMFGVSSLTTSPAATVAVIVESGARGRLSELVLGITILKDILVIVCFAAGLALGVRWLGLDAAETGGALYAKLAWEVGGSILAGGILAAAIVLYMRQVRAELTLFIVAVSFLTSELSTQLHLHALLVCMTAGVLVKNLSSRGEEFVRAIERGSLPIYVVFFGIVGAEIDLGLLSRSWALVAVLVVARTVFVWLGATAGAVAAREDRTTRNLAWQGLLSQSGVALSIAVIVAATFPGWGALYKNVLVGSIAFFEIGGPILFKLALTKAGETEEARRERLKAEG